MIKTMRYINDSSTIFAGFYESYLYNNDTLYDISNNNDELKDNEYYDFYDDKQGNYTYGQFENAVAKGCTSALLCNLVQGSNDIIKDMSFVALHSPRFYNFETDKIECDIILDWDKLLIYVQEHRDDFAEYLADNYTSRSGYVSFVPNNYCEFMDALNDDFERLSQVLIEFYILQCLDIDSYESDCMELARDELWNYIKIIKDEQ